MEDKVRFLRESLQLIEQTQGNAEPVYAFWRVNIDKIDASLVQIIPDIASQLLKAKIREQQVSIGNLFGQFSNLIQNFPLGHRGINLELAIAGYLTCTSIFTLDEYPTIWAMTQMCLGSAYQTRIAGERKDNLELAIAAHRASLEVYTRQSFPVEWAATQVFLGAVYGEQIEGERKDNLELAIAAHRASLEVYTRQSFPVEWARTQYNLGLAYKNRIEGERKDNLELAIAAYLASLEVYTRQSFPFDWAMSQNNLGGAYSDRIEGERKDNLELAIQAYRAALEIYTQQDFPVQWARIQADLENLYAYCNQNTLATEEGAGKEVQVRFLLESLKLIERTQANAVQIYAFWRMNLDKIDASLIQVMRDLAQQILVVKPQQERVPIARTFGNFSNLMQQFPLGSRRINVELAITGYQICTSIFTRNEDPIMWAVNQTNLGNAYHNRIEGERKDNLELAIAAFQAALEVRTRQDFPHEWAITQSNLGIAYIERIEGDRKDNLELAIAAFQAALEVRTQQNFPIEWAETQYFLGITYRNRIEGERKDNLELAIAAFQAALEVRTRQELPLEWAMTQSNLGAAYRNRIEGERKDNLELAIQFYQAALEVRTRQELPLEWAETQSNLGIAYIDRMEGDRKDNLELAIAAFQAALEVLQPELFPLVCLQTGRNLGDLAFKEGDWLLAIEAFEQAITAVEISRSWAMSEIRRQEIINESIDIYEKMLQSCINANRLDKALQTIERVRSKRLVDLMAVPDLYPQGAVPEPVRLILAEINNLQEQIDTLRQTPQSSSSRLIEADSRHRAATKPDTKAIQALEVAKEKLVDDLSHYDAVSAQLVDVNPPDVFEIQTYLVDRPDVALLSFYTTTQNTHILVVRADSIECFTCPRQGLQKLQVWLYNEWVIPYTQNQTSWQQQIPKLLQQLTAKLELDRLVAEHLQNVRELIVIPHLFLHLIPFTALPLNGNQQYLGEQFLIRYAPGCQVLKFCTDRPELPPQKQYGTVENATEDLPFAAIEGESIAQIFHIEEHNRLRGQEQATLEAYKTLLGRVNSVASCHHAQSRLDNPLESALFLANQRRVTLGDLLSPAWRFTDLNDVFLSCCETGMSMPKALTDEVLTLGTGFLCAGARSVISSLWAVSDIATALLSRNYHQYRAQGQDRIVALQTAQQDLRCLSGEQLQVLSEAEFVPIIEAQLDQLEERRNTARRQNQHSEEERYIKQINNLGDTLEALEQMWKQPFPFSHPYFWAGFTCQGLR